MKKLLSFLAFALLASAMTISLSACGGDDDDDNIYNEVDNGEDNEGDKPVVLCPDDNHPHAINMGDAGVWACCNIGASKPEAYGSYFAWGETGVKSDYSFETYEHKNGSEYKDIGSEIGGNITYDAATKEWGSSWRTPSSGQIRGLLQNCESRWKRINNVNGLLLTAHNGNNIFLPAAGYREGTSPKVVGYTGAYWSSSLYTTTPGNVYGVRFVSNDVGLYRAFERSYGLPVRPVQE